MEGRDTRGFFARIDAEVERVVAFMLDASHWPAEQMTSLYLPRTRGLYAQYANAQRIIQLAETRLRGTRQRISIRDEGGLWGLVGKVVYI